jgi:hypothetical protein
LTTASRGVTRCSVNSSAMQRLRRQATTPSVGDSNSKRISFRFSPTSHGAARPWTQTTITSSLASAVQRRTWFRPGLRTVSAATPASIPPPAVGYESHSSGRKRSSRRCSVRFRSVNARAVHTTANPYSQLNYERSKLLDRGPESVSFCLPVEPRWNASSST